MHQLRQYGVIYGDQRNRRCVFPGHGSDPIHGRRGTRIETALGSLDSWIYRAAVGVPLDAQTGGGRGAGTVRQCKVFRDADVHCDTET